jgi:hypothetical protein
MSAELVAVGAEARQAWRDAAPRDVDALVSQTPEWMDCVCGCGDYTDVTRLYETGNGHRLVLPLARRRVPEAVSAIGSMPFGWGTGGLISAEGQVTPGDVAAVVAGLAHERALVVAVRPSPMITDTWESVVPPDVLRIPYMSQSIDLSGGFDAVWNGFAASVRSQCRKALRRGVTVERDDTGRLMPIFDGLYRKSVDRWARQQHEPRWLARWRARRRDPQQKFQEVARRLRGSCHVWIARRAGEPIAAVVVLTHGHHSTMWRSAMDKELARGMGATELLQQTAIQEACLAGHRFYHLGDSTPGSALARNKRGYGAMERPYTGYRFERLPVTAVDHFLRRQAKRVIGFHD